MLVEKVWFLVFLVMRISVSCAKHFTSIMLYNSALSLPFLVLLVIGTHEWPVAGVMLLQKVRELLTQKVFKRHCKIMVDDLFVLEHDIVDKNSLSSKCQ